MEQQDASGCVSVCLCTYIYISQHEKAHKYIQCEDIFIKKMFSLYIFDNMFVYRVFCILIEIFLLSCMYAQNDVGGRGGGGGGGGRVGEGGKRGV